VKGVECPYCKGELREAKFVRWQYECLQCRRAWFIKDNLWFALFDASGHIYRKINDEFEMISDKKEHERLWKEVRKQLF